MDSIVFDQRDDAFEALDWPHARIVAVSRRSPRKTTANEDGALVLRLGEGRFVLAVADGVGGHAAGEEASRRTLQALLESLRSTGPRDSLREAVLAGIDRANEAVLELASGAATTLVVVVVEGGVARAYHAGDSQALIFGGRGKVRLETIPHSPVGFGVEAGFLEQDEARSHRDRHIVSNVVGDPDMHIGLSAQVTLKPRDSIVLASDGLFDNLSTEDVVQVLRRGPLDRAVRRLVDACTARMESGGHPDDLTLIAYRPRASRR